MARRQRPSTNKAALHANLVFVDADLVLEVEPLAGEGVQHMQVLRVKQPKRSRAGSGVRTQGFNRVSARRGTTVVSARRD